jgi:hypothetical protein
MSVHTTVNASFKESVSDEDIDQIILSMTYPEKYSGHLF